MNLFDASLFSQPWLSGKTDLDNMVRTSRSWAAEITPEQLAAFSLSLKTGEEETPPYTVKNGVAVISVSGALTKEPLFFSFFSDPARIRTFSDLLSAAAAADADPDVDKKVLNIDCNGSTVAGCFEAVSALTKSAKVKPIYTYVNSNMKSGGLLIGSVGQLIGAPRSAEIGSIGVRCAHINESKLNEKIGIEITHLAAGEYKTMGNSAEPLSPKAKEYFLDQLNTIYTMFVDTIAENRSMAVDDVLKAADGKIFLGADAKENGLIDVLVDDLDSFISTITKEDTRMDLKELKTKHPALHDQVRDDGLAEGRRLAADENRTAIETAETAARADAQGTVIAFVGAIAGQDVADKIKKLVDAGLTVDQISAVQGVFVADTPAPPAGENQESLSESGSRQAILTALQNAGNPPVDGQNLGGANGAPKTLEAAAEGFIQADKDLTKAKAMSKAIKAFPALHKEYIERVNKK